MEKIKLVIYLKHLDCMGFENMKNSLYVNPVTKEASLSPEKLSGTVVCIDEFPGLYPKL